MVTVLWGISQPPRLAGFVYPVGDFPENNNKFYVQKLPVVFALACDTRHAQPLLLFARLTPTNWIEGASEQAALSTQKHSVDRVMLRIISMCVSVKQKSTRGCVRRTQV